MKSTTPGMNDQQGRLLFTSLPRNMGMDHDGPLSKTAHGGLSPMRTLAIDDAVRWRCLYLRQSWASLAVTSEHRLIRCNHCDRVPGEYLKDGRAFTRHRGREVTVGALTEEPRRCGVPPSWSSLALHGPDKGCHGNRSRGSVGNAHQVTGPATSGAA